MPRSRLNLPAAMRPDRSSAILPRLAVLPMLAAALALSGCVAQYRVPAGAPSASVRLVTSTDENTSFTIVDPARCPDPARPLVLAGMGKQLSAMGRERSLDMAGRSPEPPARTRERLVEAGRRIYVAVTSAAAPPLPEMRCAAGVSFVPAAGAQYEIRYQRDETASQCSARILRLQPLADGSARLTAEPTQQGFRALRKDYVCQAL
ncbi:hypothetical protein [Cupriavidus sp. MP-37]|uniref:hypothetical protein n=1 Tax=Cupriavidus sp. MP-37 TaxID=2884455 RepID=UPI001D0B0634|nr:hypothetical protein [Cupriavidus sp. MP-37]UDM52536.1 hypothetical protein LIN44_25265 [Cupriavidus sp. MP-37]